MPFPNFFCSPRISLGRIGLLVLFSVGSALLPTSSAWADGHATEEKGSGSIEFVAENLFSTASGSFHEWRVASRTLSASAPDEGEVIVEVTLSSVDTGINRRDEHLLTADFFDIEKFPVATVRGHSLVAAGLSDAGHPVYAAKFDVDLHGVTKTVSGEIELVKGDSWIAKGRLVLDRMDFGIGPEPSRWNPMSIDPEIPIAFHFSL